MPILSRKPGVRSSGGGPRASLGGKAKLALARLLLEQASQRGDGGAGESGASMRPGMARPASLWTPLNPWLKAVTPDWEWDWPHLVIMQETLGRILSGELRKVMFFIPPRHGKTEQNTVRFASYVLEHDPAFRFIVWAYNQTLVEKFSRKIRRLSSERMELSHERKAAQEWETEAGGGVRAAGVGVGITGMGANGVIIDDPVKSREEAESEAYRDRVWDSYRDDLYTRLEPGGFVVLTMTRWHEDDLAGRILASEDGPNWHVVCMPAIGESQDNRDEWARKHGQPKGLPDPLGRQEGEALCPDRYGVDDLSAIRRVLGSYGFEALYQQRPSPPGGMMFKREWFDILPERPTHADAWIRAWDLAGSKDGDYTAGVLMARMSDGRFIVVDIVRGQWTPGERDKVILQTAAMDGPEAHIHIEQEPGSSGKSVVEYLIKALAGYRVYAERPTGEKSVRAQPFAAQCEGRNVSIVRGAWNAAYMDELTAFPNGRNDDQVDGSSSGFNRLALAYRPHGVVVSGARPDYQPRPSVAPQRPAGGIPGALRR